MFEKLTDEERESIVRARLDGSGVKALRIIDQQRALLERALEFCNEWPSHDNGKLRSDIRKGLDGEDV